MRRLTLEDFWSRITKSTPDACWEWAGPMYKNGYGQAYLNTVHGYSHRFAYELLVGPIPDGLVIDHLCRNRACCNPAHMEPVTTRVNLLRGEGPTARLASQTHCVRGHEFAAENRGINGKGHRYCRKCHATSHQRLSPEKADRRKEQMRNYYHARKQSSAMQNG